MDDPDAFIRETAQIIQDKHAHPVIAQMIHPDVRDDLPPSECGSSDNRSGVRPHSAQGEACPGFHAPFVPDCFVRPLGCLAIEFHQVPFEVIFTK